MINLYSKQDLLNSLIEARKSSFAEFSEQVELAKSIYGNRFVEKVWEYFNVNLEYTNTNEGIVLLDEAISNLIYKPLNEDKNIE